MSREWTEKIMTIYNGLIKQLWERRVFRKELEWDEYENLIYLIKLLTFFGRKCMEIRSMKKNNLQKESADF